MPPADNDNLEIFSFLFNIAQYYRVWSIIKGLQQWDLLHGSSSCHSTVGRYFWGLVSIQAQYYRVRSFIQEINWFFVTSFFDSSLKSTSFEPKHKTQLLPFFTIKITIFFFFCKTVAKTWRLHFKANDDKVVSIAHDNSFGPNLVCLITN